MITGTQRIETVRRLKRIEGQVRGIADMIDSERYCIDVLTQIAAVHEALRGVSKQVVENHLGTCVASAESGDEADRNEKLREFVETMYRFVR
jgi:CsoR family transcriptional regulator, copper-sensing transcriptional repressor